ncbi:PilW family protein [Halomonas mongoliensis]|uniref:PilW family protein n=1 Tax=Halomonas mongoliensis TaxID=321265 RepID=UPI00403B22C3
MKKSSGFSLIELMVAMVIGLIIILGAGQLFLTVFQTNRQVETLSEKQAAVNFAVETLLRDIRRASDISPVAGGLSLTVLNRGDVSASCGLGDEVVKVYKLDGSELQVSQDCGDGGGFQPVVSGFLADSLDFDDTRSDDGVWVVSFGLIATDGGGGSDEFVFHAVNRTAAVSN